ncbi:hypothetical protein HPT25_01580 [Bacillus sp. BRMEA1]|uniref:hypothetical protein n=1 Tax=Neobacillus endophyticus TaxID=2738405 RepID=UPI0015647B9E|nr:hypothetical protein [Neobacillus endophyticus]NRD76199.1 hypothetical protein [Neobacillus endophyticus]
MKNKKIESTEEKATQSIGELELGERIYTVYDSDEKIIFKDTSTKGVKVDFSFSKDKQKNKLARDGWKQFWSEVYK